MIKVGIIGATGYAGGELARLLAAHREAEVVWYGSRSYAGQEYSRVFQNMFRMADGTCMDEELEALAGEADVIFTATPQGYCAAHMDEKVLGKTRVIDLSADFRLKDTQVYEQWYGITHKSPEYTGEAVYGLCEWNREEIRRARLVANPGCYPTCTVMAIAPLLREGLLEPDSLIIDAKSGVSGAGRQAAADNLFCEVNENMKAYKVGNHRHTPEIEEQLSLAAGRPVKVTFTPHLAPMNRGILVTAYARLAEGAREQDVRDAYEKHYGGETFVRLLRGDDCPQTKWVEGSNFVDLNFKMDSRTGRIILMGAMDNLVKGAAGQAVQNMNLMFGLDEAEGLRMAPLFP